MGLSRCERCRFHGWLSGEIMCDYIQVAGRSRIGQMPREEWDKRCRFFEPGRKVPLKFKPITESTRQEPRYRFDQRKMRELYDAGLRDYQIACEMGCTAETVKGFRERNGLPPRKPEYKREFPPEQLRAIYDKGLTDREIAEAAGCSKDTVEAFRHRERLPAVRKRGVMKT